MLFKISIALHIIGIVMWVGSILFTTRMIALSIKSSEGNISTALRQKIFWGWTLPGLLLTTLTGIYQLLFRGFGFYFSQGWFHGKVTLVIVLLVVSFLFAKLCLDEELPKSQAKPMALHGITGLVLIIVTFLTIFGIK